ncbi:MAG: S1C family serine protease [Planctomycetota bacterium]|jgi:S1-C subfamily serine protease
MRALLCLVLLACSNLSSQEPQLHEVFGQVHSSVVTIVTAQREVDPRMDKGLTTTGGVGSGVLISKDGSILTAAHVVQTSDKLTVIFADGSKHSARVRGSDALNDVALIKLDQAPPGNAYVAPVGDSDNVMVGHRAFVVGAPRGISHSLTVGYISARRTPARVINSVKDTELFQTDAAINPGNSGGPLFSMRGEVIGIVSHIITASGGSEGLGFAVTSNVAKALLIDAPAFWSGVEYVRVADDLSKVLNIPGGRSAALVQHVARGSIAERAGLKGGTLAAIIAGESIVLGGDVILGVGEVPIGEPEDYPKLREYMRSLRDGQEFEIQVLRAGEQVTLSGRMVR